MAHLTMSMVAIPRAHRSNLHQLLPGTRRNLIQIKLQRSRAMPISGLSTASANAQTART